MALDDAMQKALLQHLSFEQIRTEDADVYPYGYDNSKQHVMPDGVVFPQSHADVVNIVNICNQFNMPLIARGRGTGTVGGCIPVHGGLVISFEKMRRVLKVDRANRILIAEPGATNQEIQEAAKACGFFWPPDPTSAAFCTLGGNLAYNSAGPRAVKYGTPRENTLGLKVVTGAGNTLSTGGQTTKGVVGYDLTRLLIGSEGSLAITTEATLKLTPLSETIITLQALYQSQTAATQAITDIMAQPIIPYSLEYMDHHALKAIANYRSDIDLPSHAEAMLLIALDGNEHTLPSQREQIKAAAQNAGLLQFSAAENEQEAERLWAIRKALSPSLRHIAPKKINEDVVVPVANLTKLITGITQLCQDNHIQNANFGHAGNGNIHVNLLIDPNDEEQMQRGNEVLEQLFALVLKLGGSLSGEHGTGLAKLAFIERELGAEQIALMHAIKQQFDPNGILNPGKI